MPISIFISYARTDINSVESIYKFLLDSGMSPWMDVHNILPGENWETAINQAIKKSDLFIAILTSNSVDRRGVIQKELKQGLEKRTEFLPDDIYFIPVRLDSCEIPDRFASIQILDWNGGRNKTKLLTAINEAQKRLGKKTPSSTIQKTDLSKIDLKRILLSKPLPSGFSGGTFKTNPSWYPDSNVILNFVQWEIFGKFNRQLNNKEHGFITVFIYEKDSYAINRYNELKDRNPPPQISSAQEKKTVNLNGYGDEASMKFTLSLGWKKTPPLPPLLSQPGGPSWQEQEQYKKDLDAINYIDVHESCNITIRRSAIIYHVDFVDFTNIYWKYDFVPSEDKFTSRRYEFLDYTEGIDQQLKIMLRDG